MFESPLSPAGNRRVEPLSEMTTGQQNELAIVFDFGNVLLDWDARYLYRPFFPDEASMQHFFEEVDFYAWNRIQDAGRPFQIGIAELCQKHPHWADMIRLYDEKYSTSLRGPIEGSVKILEKLHQAGRPLYGLSNYSLEKFTLVRPDYPFFDWFDQIVLSGEVGINKPAPRIFQILLERTGRQAADCLFIDDTLDNVRAAEVLGFDVIHFQGPEQLARRLVQKGLLE